MLATKRTQFTGMCEGPSARQPAYFYELGKVHWACVALILQEGAVPLLAQMLGSQQESLARAAAVALMMVTVVREGKYAMVETQAQGGFQLLAQALDSRKEQLCTDVMQVGAVLHLELQSCQQPCVCMLIPAAV